MWDTSRRAARRKDDLVRSVEVVNGQNKLGYNRKRSPNDYMADREFLIRHAWKKDGEGFVYVTSPEESDARPITDNVVRGKYPSAMRIKRKSDRETTLEYVIHPDAGGLVPSFIFNRFLGSNLRRVTEIQEYFQAQRGLEDWNADDARAVGEAMCIKTKAEKGPEKGESKVGARMRELFKQKGLREIGRKHEFFQCMMTRVVENKLRPAGTVNTPLCDVSKREGEVMARGLAVALAGNLTAEAGVDEWILQQRSLIRLDREEAWFRWGERHTHTHTSGPEFRSGVNKGGTLSELCGSARPICERDVQDGLLRAAGLEHHAHTHLKSREGAKMSSFETTSTQRGLGRMNVALSCGSELRIVD